jgi:hypothetical protein
MGRVLRDRITLASKATLVRGFLDGFWPRPVSPEMAFMGLYDHF